MSVKHWNTSIDFVLNWNINIILPNYLTTFLLFMGDWNVGRYFFKAGKEVTFFLINSGSCDILLERSPYQNNIILMISHILQWLMWFKTMSEVFSSFKEYNSMATAHFQRKIFHFRCDKWQNVYSSYLLDFVHRLVKRNTNWHVGPIRYTSQQNGKVEQMNRTIVEGAVEIWSALIIQSLMSLTYLQQLITIFGSCFTAYFHITN